MLTTISLACAASLLLVWLAAPAAGQSRPVALPERPEDVPAGNAVAYVPPPAAKRDLECGARVLVIEDHSLPLVEGALVFRGGSVRDPEALAGLCEVAADALREGGSSSWSGRELDAWLDARAASIEVHAGEDALWVRFACLAEDWQAVLARAVELVRRPAFPAEILEQARARALAAVERRGDDAGALAEAGVARIAYGWRSPWGRQSSRASLAAITSQHLAEWQAGFAPDRLVAGFAGDAATDAVAEQLARALDGWDGRGQLAALEPPIFETPASTIVYLIDRPGVPQTEIRIGAPGVARPDKSWPALSLWSYLVGTGGMSNRMLAEVRTARGLAYSVGAVCAPGWLRAGETWAWCGTKNESVAAALEAMVEVLADSGAKAAAPADLDAARARWLNADVFRVDSPRKVLQRALEIELAGAPPSHFEDTLAMVKKLAGETVRAAAARYVAPTQLVVVAAGPRADIERQLLSLAEVRVLDSEPGPRSSGEGAQAVERLLASMGGRERWASIAAVETRGTHVLAAKPADLVVPTRQVRDLDGPRARIEYESTGVTTVQVVNGTQGSSEKGAQRSRFTPAQVAGMLRQERRWLPKLLHRLAAGDRDLGATLDERGRVVIHEDRGPLCAIEIAGDGRPAALVVQESGRESRYDYDSWLEQDGLLFARVIRQSEPAGTITIDSVVVNPALEARTFEVLR